MKPKILLHICCAPDEAWVVHTLCKEYLLHCFFCNPNIFPESEYNLRLEEARKVAFHYGVAFTADAYEPGLWESAVEGFSETPEGGERCRRCFDIRLSRTARFCADIGFKAFTTVMSISPHKRISMINEAGKAAAAAFGVEFLPFDFKKKDGFKKSIALSKDLGLYRQNYCGCRLSLMERDERMRLKPERQSKDSISGEKKS